MSTPTTTTTVLSRPTQRLRASCDACASSKVKCDKEQPACRRCLVGGTECVYGVSRKHGKQPHRRRSTTDGKLASNALAPRIVEDVSPSRLGHFPPELDLGFDDLLHDMGLPDGMSSLRCQEQDLYNLPTPQSPLADNDWASMVGQSPFFPPDFRQPRKHNQITRSPHSAYEDMTMESTEDVRFPRDPISLPSSGPSCSSQSSRITSVSRGTPGSESRWRPSALERNDPQPYSCYNLASSALEMRYGCTKKRTLDGPGSSPLPILNLDHILEANKIALNTLQQTIECKCSEKHAPLAFLYASIISKVIFWYQVAGRMIRSACASPTSPSRFASAAHSALPDNCAHIQGSPVAGSFIARSLESLPVSIGGFDIDAEDRATLSRHLLLSELRKAARIVERLQGRRSESDSDSIVGFSNAGGTRDLYGMLGSWLKSELASTIREVKNQERDDRQGEMSDRRSAQYSHT